MATYQRPGRLRGRSFRVVHEVPNFTAEEAGKAVENQLRPNRMRGLSFSINDAEISKVINLLSRDVKDHPEEIDLVFEEVHPMRPDRVRGMSFLMRAEDGHELQLLNEESEEDTAKKNACRKALFELIKTNRENAIKEDSSDSNKKKLILTGVPVKDIIKYFEKNGGTSDLVGR